MEAITAIGLVVALLVVVGGFILLVTRHSRLRSWRFGVFYESHDQWDDDNEKKEE